MIHTRQPAAFGSEGTPYRHLAVRVIDQAFRDLARPAGSPVDQQSARAFLAGSSMFYHWCEVADLDPAWMVARARKLMASSGGFSAPAAIEAVGSPKGATFCARTENPS